MAFHRSFLALVFVLFLALGAPLYGWDNLGHMTVAYVAYQHLNAPTKTRINTLLRKNPDYQSWVARVPAGTSAARRKMMIFMMAATWPDAIKSKPGYTDDGSEGSNRRGGATSVQNLGHPDHLHH